MNLQELFNQSGLSQAKVARALSISTAVVNQCLSGEYSGDRAKYEAKIRTYLENQSLEQAPHDLEEVVIETDDLKYMKFTLFTCAKRKRMGLISGAPGTGKTFGLKQILKEKPEALLLECEPDTDYGGLLGHLCELTGVKRHRGNGNTARALYAYFRQHSKILLVDEGERLSRKALEGLRSIWDRTRTPILLAGTEELKSKLTQSKGRVRELAQLYSRIAKNKGLGGLKFKDCQDYCRRFQIPFAKEIFKFTEGNWRNLVHAVESILDFAEYGEIHPLGMDLEQIKQCSILN